MAVPRPRRLATNHVVAAPERTELTNPIAEGMRLIHQAYIERLDPIQSTPTEIAALFRNSAQHIRNVLKRNFRLGVDYFKPGKEMMIPRATAERIIREHLCRI